MRFLPRWFYAALLPRFTARVFAGVVSLVIAPAFPDGVALANGPDTVAVAHHAPVARHRRLQPPVQGLANTNKAAPPVVVVLSTVELSRGPAQASGAVSLPMSFGQPVAPEDELAATPAVPSAATKHRGGSHVSRRQTHLATTAKEAVLF